MKPELVVKNQDDVPKRRILNRKKIDDADPVEVIGARIREARELSGLSVTQLAALLGVTRSAVSATELGKSGVNIGVLERIASALQTSVEWLRYGAGNGPRIPRPVVVPEINVDHVSFQLAEMMEFRTENEWAVPLSDVRRLGLAAHQLIAIRLNEAIPPEFKAGDVVVVDLSANQFSRHAYYAVAIEGRFTICLLNRSGSKFEAAIQKRTLITSEPNILGMVVCSYRFTGNFTLPLEAWKVR